MDETQTQIAWPSKLKIGAKSKKGEVSPLFIPNSSYTVACVQLTFGGFNVEPIGCMDMTSSIC